MNGWITPEQRKAVEQIRRARIAALKPNTDHKHPDRPARLIYVGEQSPSSPVWACTECLERLLDFGYVVAKAKGTTR